MSLLKTETANKSTDMPITFEDEDTMDTVAAQPAATAQPATTTAVAERKTTAVSPIQTLVNPLEQYKDVLRVDYNTLEQCIVNQGNFVLREDNKVLGDVVTFEVQSWQDAWVVSPEDDDAPNDVVRYSNDGVMCSDNSVTVAEHLNWLRTNGYPKARLKQRVVVVAALLEVSKATAKDKEGCLVQFDLSPANRTQWLRYAANTAFQIKMGKFTQEQVMRVTATAEIANSNGNNYTLSKFAVAK